MKMAKCHPSRKHCAKGLCKACYEYQRIKNNPILLEKDKIRKKEQRRKKMKNPKFRAEQNKKWREYRIRKLIENPNFDRDRHLKQLYRIDTEKYENILQKQDRKCAICRTKELNTKNRKDKYFHIDHCHDTGEVRGVLCHECNRLLSCAKDSVEVLRNAIKYLER